MHNSKNELNSVIENLISSYNSDIQSIQLFVPKLILTKDFVINLKCGEISQNIFYQIKFFYKLL